MLETDGDVSRIQSSVERMKVQLNKVLEIDGEKMIEFISGLWWVLVGITVVLPTNTFASSSGYKLFVEAHISEDILGVFYILVGLAIWTVLASRNVRARRWSMLISCGLYSAVATLFVFAGPTAGTGYYANALMDLWAYLHLRNLMVSK